MVDSERSPDNQTYEIAGHAVVYRKLGDVEEVVIDGQAMPFFRVGEAYQLEASAYDEPHATLLEAAEAFAHTLPSRNE